MWNRNRKMPSSHARRSLTFAALGLSVMGICVGFVTSSSAGLPQISDETQIRTVLEDQTAAWNRGDIDGFMAGYWKSDQTEFVGSDGVLRGWQTLLERYKRSYPDRKAMGTLSFSNLEIRVECSNSGYAVGEYHLQREKDNPAGVFTLNFRKFPEGWRVVVDHTTSFATAPPAAKRD